MKIACIDMANLKYMPYVKSYLNVIDLKKNDVHIINWQRESDDITIDSRVTMHSFFQPINSHLPLHKKFFSIIRYRKFLVHEIKNISPDFLIVHYQTTALLIFGLLKRRYKEKFILDFRDLTYEKNKIYRKLIAKIVSYSKYTFCSSDGFLLFLPSSPKIYRSHNVDLSTISNPNLDIKENFNGQDVIRIGFWGNIRNDKTNNSFIDNVSNRKDVELHYYGRAEQGLIDKMTCSKNVYYHGIYNPDDRFIFSQSTDLLLNAFDNDDKNTPYATSNKFYDGIVFHIPQICTKGSVMGDMCEKYGIGVTVDIRKSNFIDEILDYYLNLTFERFKENCKIAFSDILKSVDLYINIVDKEFNSK